MHFIPSGCFKYLFIFYPTLGDGPIWVFVHIGWNHHLIHSRGFVTQRSLGFHKGFGKSAIELKIWCMLGLQPAYQTNFLTSRPTSMGQNNVFFCFFFFYSFCLFFFFLVNGFIGQWRRWYIWYVPLDGMIPIDELLYQDDMRLEVCQNLLLSICSGILSDVGDIFLKKAPAN